MTQGTDSRSVEPSCTERLAELFPQSSRMRIPVRVTALYAGEEATAHEETIIEFGTEFELLFSSVLPFEFNDRVRVVNSNGSLDTRATVVAVRYQRQEKAVAVRFENKIRNWIITS